MRQSAVLQKLMVIGEASGKVSVVVREGHPEVRWKGAIGLRNIAVHDYFGIDLAAVWETIVDDIPTLRTQVAAILNEKAFED